MLHTGTVLLSLKYYEVTIRFGKAEGKINVCDDGRSQGQGQPHH